MLATRICHSGLLFCHFFFYAIEDIHIFLKCQVVCIGLVGFFHNTLSFKHDELLSDLIYKIPVMADKDHCTLEAKKLLLQDIDGMDIQIIGGLIEDQAVDFLGKRAVPVLRDSAHHR